MARLFKINTLNSDGSDADVLIEHALIDPATNKPYVDDEGKPSVVVTLKPISNDKRKQVEAAHTERLLNKKSRAMEDVTDWEAYRDELITYTIQGWTGVIGADNKPLQCVADAKVGLPGDIKTELMQRAMQGESIDAAASFRQSA